MIAQFYVKKFRQGKVLQSWGSLLKGSPHQSDGYELTDGHQTYRSFHADARKMALIKVMGVYIHTHSQTSVILFIRK